MNPRDRHDPAISSKRETGIESPLKGLNVSKRTTKLVHAHENPFTPSFGVSPPLLVGRDVLVDEFVDALEDGRGSAESFLLAMARDDGPSRMKDFQERLDIDGNLLQPIPPPTDRLGTHRVDPPRLR